MPLHCPPRSRFVPYIEFAASASFHLCVVFACPSLLQPTSCSLLLSCHAIAGRQSRSSQHCHCNRHEMYLLEGILRKVTFTFLDIVVCQSPAILQLLSGKYQPLLIRWNSCRELLSVSARILSNLSKVT